MTKKLENMENDESGNKATLMLDRVANTPKLDESGSKCTLLHSQPRPQPASPGPVGRLCGIWGKELGHVLKE